MLDVESIRTCNRLITVSPTWIWKGLLILQCRAMARRFAQTGIFSGGAPVNSFEAKGTDAYGGLACWWEIFPIAGALSAVRFFTIKDACHWVKVVLESERVKSRSCCDLGASLLVTGRGGVWKYDGFVIVAVCAHRRV